MNKKFKVVILQHRLLHYRVGFFNRLHDLCEENGIDLHLIHGQPTKNEIKKKDVGHISWADTVVNRYLTLFGKDILWQEYPNKHRDADLIVLMQENRLISNYPILFKRFFGGPKVAFWGHGANFQSNSPKGVREKWKQFWLNKVDWWFAYTELTKNIVCSYGFSVDRISVLNNAIDNKEFSDNFNSITDLDISNLKSELGLNDKSVVGIFCGSLYPDKRIEFMVRSCDLIKSEINDFHLVVIGDGPGYSQIFEMSKTRPWIHVVGVKKGRDKAIFFRLAKVVVNPGLVGLHILDSFCSGIPMVTTSDAKHSPEVSYLENGVNGIVVTGSESVYANEIVALLRDESRYALLCSAAEASARYYSLDNMVNNFYQGVVGIKNA